MEVSGGRHCWVWLLVLKVGPSVLETDSMLIGAEVVWGSSTKCERQSAALFLAPDIHSKCYVVGCQLKFPIYLLCYLHSFHSTILWVACDHFWLWCLHLGNSNSTWWQPSKLCRPLVPLCSTFFGSPKKCEIRRWLGILCCHFLVSTGLSRHHLMHLYKLYISCWGWGIVELVPVLWNLSVSGRLHDVLESIQI